MLAAPVLQGTARLLERLPNIRAQRNGWLAVCPSHDDHGPSLSITETHDRTLLNCFASCTSAQVVSALGMRLSDLFAEKTTTPRARQPKAVEDPPAREVMEAAVKSELDQIAQRLAQSMGYAPPLRAIHHNVARKRVSARLGIAFQRVSPFWWECNPHDSDPAWPFLFERAVYEIDATASPTTADRRLLDRAALVARSWLREMAAW